MALRPPRDAMDERIDERINAAMLSLDVGLPGSDRRRAIVAMINRTLDDHKRQDEKRNETKKLIIGIIASVVLSALMTVGGLMMGAFTWLLQTSGWKP